MKTTQVRRSSCYYDQQILISSNSASVPVQCELRLNADVLTLDSSCSGCKCCCAATYDGWIDPSYTQPVRFDSYRWLVSLPIFPKEENYQVIKISLYLSDQARRLNVIRPRKQFTFRHVTELTASSTWKFILLKPARSVDVIKPRSRRRN